MKYVLWLCRSWSIVDLQHIRQTVIHLESMRLLVWRLIRRHASSVGAVNVFDRSAKRRQKNRASVCEDPSVYDYLKDAVATNIVDRVCDVVREFPLALDLGCGRGHIAKQTDRDLVQCIVQADYTSGPLSQSPVGVATHRVIADEEFLPFRPSTFNLVTSSCSLHWVNDLQAAFNEVYRVLKPDGCVIGSMFTGDTLFELRCSLQLAQQEVEGGFSPHISPFVQLTDLGSLLSGAGFTMTTMDCDEIIVNYPSMNELMKDLKGMGESNAAYNRPHYIRRDTLKLAGNKYKELYGNSNGTVPATFQLLYFIGWKPDRSQKGPAKRGSGTVPLGELGDVISRL